MEHFHEYISITIQVCIWVGSAIWAVLKIKTSTDNLGMALDHLREAISELKDAHHEISLDLHKSKDRVTQEITLLRERIGIIESRCITLHSEQLHRIGP